MNMVNRQVFYVAPDTEVIEIRIRQIVCQSGIGMSDDQIENGGEL